MTFPADQYRELMQLLERLDHEIDNLVAGVDSAVQTGLRTLEELKDWLGDVVDSAIKALYALGRKIKEVLKMVQDELDRLRVGGNAPLLAVEFAGKWHKLRELATQVSGSVKDPSTRFSPDDWSGKAADKYFVVVGPQVAATDRMASSMEKVATALLDAAKETRSFVTAVATAVAVIIMAAGLATLAVASGVGAAAGLITFVGACGAFFFAVKKAADDYAAAQLKLAIALEADAKDVTQFPAGKWPQATSAMISDAPAK